VTPRGLHGSKWSGPTVTLLAVLEGNAKPTDADIKKILSSVGIEADATNIKRVIEELKDKNLAAGAASSSAPAAAKDDAPKAAEKKEEPIEEDEEDEDMGFGVFD
jgi:large subunit ribosomal protein LP2